MRTTRLRGLVGLAASSYAQKTYHNPIIPGFHPDPSCIFVPEWDNTFFCASSSFIAFPAMPIHASRDLVNWKLVSHVQNRPEQSPTAGNITRSSGGWYAPTLRFHNGTFYVINVDVDAAAPSSGIFTTTDPYDNAAWSDVIPVDVGGYDPDIFFDQDGTIYSQAAITINSDPFTTEIQQFTIDLPSGNTTPRKFLTNGTNVQPPEGPHMYYKDGEYWLLLAEGGTALDHQVTISRSKHPTGPWKLDPANPILTALPNSLFQTVGHADLFQDADGNWWGVALSTRSGPEYVHWPMNRETVLYPVSWPKGEWPTLDPVRGTMSGPLPPQDLNIPGTGPFVKDPDHYTFPRGSTLPRHFTFWRFPHPEKYTISPAGHTNSLRLSPSNANLTGFPSFSATAGQTFVGRRQTDTLFRYTIDMEFSPSSKGEEAGVTMFLAQERNAALGIVYTKGAPHLRFRASGPEAPATVLKPLPKGCEDGNIKFEIHAFNFTHYSFSAGPIGHKGKGKMEEIALVDNALFSTSFTGRIKTNVPYTLLRLS
jgi:beta-xylosidase